MDARPPESALVSVAAAASPRPPVGQAVEVAGVPAQPVPQTRALVPLVPAGLPLAGPRRTAWRLVLVALLALAPLVGVVGLGVAFHLFGGAKKPNRSTPAAVVDTYLKEFLVNRDDSVASGLVCPGAPDPVDFRKMRDGVGVTGQSGPPVSFTWTTDAVTPVGPDAASLDMEVVLTAGTVGRAIQRWTFVTHLRGEWCVASVTRIP